MSQSTPTPVQSTDVQSALVNFVKVVSNRLNLDAQQLADAAKQHASDQTTISMATSQIAQDAAGKAAEDAALAQAQSQAANPQLVSQIDAATNAVLTGQPLPEVTPTALAKP